MSEKTKYPVIKIVSEYNSDSRDWIIPVNKIKGFPKLGGGLKEFVHYIESITDMALDDLGHMDISGEPLFDITIEFWTRAQLEEVNIDE